MKKVVIIAMLGFASSVVGHAQSVLFNNYSGSSQTTGITFGDGPLAGMGVGSEFTAQLFYGPAGSTDISSLQAIGNPSTFVTSLGYDPVSGGGAIADGSGAGWFGSGAVNLPAFNTTYAMAYYVSGTYLGVTYSGFSPIVDVTSQASSGVPTPQLPDSLRFASFSAISPVPEPATLALAGLGGLAALVAFRRKQA